MKKIFSLFLLCFIVILFAWQWKTSLSSKIEPSILPTSSPTADSSEGHSLRGYSYTFIQTSIEKVSLFSNYTEKLSAIEARQTYNCSTLVNAGFYTTEDRPIGLFINQPSGKLREYRDSETFNSLFGKTPQNTFLFSDTYDSDLYEYAIQLGPKLITNGTVHRLTIRNDENARRVVLASANSSLYFLVYYDPSSVFLGPTLTELPQLVFDSAKSLHISFDQAVNLDGGSASVFLNDSARFTEITHAGSFFCVK
jgi:uncharacterized protein YigE (DUF2233 family)